MKFEEGQIVWTCQPSIESNDELPRKPREVKLRFSNGIWYGHSFNYETGDMDTDYNASIFARETNCFSTKKEANDLYIHLYRCYIDDLQDELNRFEENRED